MLKKILVCLLSVTVLTMAVACEFSEPYQNGDEQDPSTSITSSDSEPDAEDSSDVLEPSDSSDSVEPSDSSDSVEPSDSSDSVEPSDSSDSVEPSDSSDSVEPSDPSDSSESGDDPIDPPDEPEVVHPDTTGMKKILFLGNSHAKDTFITLPELFKAEGYTGYTFGLAYIGQTSLADHATNINNNNAKYLYYRSLNGATVNTPNGKTSGEYNLATFASILQDQDWDLVIMQICMRDVVEVGDLNASARQTIVNHIHTYAPNAEIGTSISWLAPYADDYTNVEIPDKWASIIPLYNNYGTTDAEHFARHCYVMNNYILNDSTYYISFSMGTAVYYANKILGVASGNVNNDGGVLYRDAVHMSIYGRALVAYSFFAQFTGQEIDHVSLNAVSAAVANGAYYDKSNIPALTAAQKSVIIQTANYTFNHPWVVPTAA